MLCLLATCTVNTHLVLHQVNLEMDVRKELVLLMQNAKNLDKGLGSLVMSSLSTLNVILLSYLLCDE